MVYPFPRIHKPPKRSHSGLFRAIRPPRELKGTVPGEPPPILPLRRVGKWTRPPRGGGGYFYPLRFPARPNAGVFGSRLLPNFEDAQPVDHGEGAWLRGPTVNRGLAREAVPPQREEIVEEERNLHTVLRSTEFGRGGSNTRLSTCSTCSRPSSLRRTA